MLGSPSLRIFFFIADLQSSLVVDRFLRYTNDRINPRIGVIHFYFDYKYQSKQKAEDVIRSLLKQSVYELDSILEEVKSAYQQASEKGQQPNIKALIDLFIACSRKFAQIFIFLDAYDECAESERKSLATFFRHLDAGANIRTYVTTGNHLRTELKTLFPSVGELEIIAAERDVTTYLTDQLADRKIKEELKQKIIKTISTQADRMYDLHLLS